MPNEMNYNYCFGNETELRSKNPTAATDSKNERPRMIRKLAFTTLVSVLLAAQGARAGDFWSNHFHSEANGDKFATETTVDAFGVLKMSDGESLFDGSLGVGVGINHFFGRYF